MSNAEEKKDIFQASDLELLEKNRKIKEKLISVLLGPDPDHPEIPGDKSNKTLLMGLLDSLDKEVMNRTKIRIIAKTEENTSDIRDLATQLLMNFKPGQFSTKPDKPIEELLEPPADIQYRAPVPGEMEVGTVNLTLKDIEE